MTARGALSEKRLQLHGCTYFDVSGAHCQLKINVIAVLCTVFVKTAVLLKTQARGSTVLIGVCSIDDPLPVKL